MHLAASLGYYDPAKPDFAIAWVIDFPSFIWDDEEKRWAANHHPFTAPMDEDLHKLESDPGSVRAKAYDLVINGYECAGGSIRIHNPEVQGHLFRALGMTTEQALATATRVNATLLPMEKSLGAVAPGTYADIVALQGDPLADITVVLKGVRWVMKNGQVVVNRTETASSSSSNVRE